MPRASDGARMGRGGKDQPPPAGPRVEGGKAGFTVRKSGDGLGLGLGGVRVRVRVRMRFPPP